MAKSREEIARREAEEAAVKAALLKEHELDGLHPTEGGAYRRTGDTLERIVEDEDDNRNGAPPASQERE